MHTCLGVVLNPIIAERMSRFYSYQPSIEPLGEKYKKYSVVIMNDTYRKGSAKESVTLDIEGLKKAILHVDYDADWGAGGVCEISFNNFRVYYDPNCSKREFSGDFDVTKYVKSGKNKLEIDWRNVGIGRAHRIYAYLNIWAEETRLKEEEDKDEDMSWFERNVMELIIGLVIVMMFVNLILGAIL